MRLFSYKNRPVHLGPYPLERLQKSDTGINLENVPKMRKINFLDSQANENLVNALGPYAAMLDIIRDGPVKKERAELPYNHQERSKHLKAFAYYHDASQAGVCELEEGMFLSEPIVNPDVKTLTRELDNKQTETLASGIDVVMDELKDVMATPLSEILHHTHALVFLYEYPRNPKVSEAGCDWILNTQAQRACVRAAETVAVLSNYIRLLGYEARGHTGSCSDVDLNKLAVASGLGEVLETDHGPVISNPFIGTRFGLGAITTNFVLDPDKPLKSASELGLKERIKSHGPAWWLGKGFEKNAFNVTPYQRRKFKDGAYPFERTKRVAKPTTFIDELRVPRVPKRTDMFARAIFGDMGKAVQDAARNGNYVRKSATSAGPRRPLGAFVLMQDGPVAHDINPTAKDSQRNADNIKGALYFLGADAVGISRCPDWVYYSHDAVGEKIDPYHKNAISVIIDQGHETMEGASGDDWIACSQSMRAYLRFSLLGGIIAQQIRNLGYSARTHTVMDGEVLQPPLLLLSGLGEVSRIGEVILNPYLGPRLKSGVITTDMPLRHDLPIDFGLQNFCNACNKCARECPAGAITTGPKSMFNGYEIWKSDSQKCVQYRITQKAGAMCGRCMKTCPWNLEGLFAEAPFRWAASNVPAVAKSLAKLDDKLGHGEINSLKKWWWDLEMVNDGPYTLSTHGSNARDLQIDLDVKFEDQTLAVYPSHLAPLPYPYPSPMDREAGIQAYQDLLSPAEYKQCIKNGTVSNLTYKAPDIDEHDAPVMRVRISKVDERTANVSMYELASLDGSPLPEFGAGAHLDVVVAPEFFRPFSLCSDPADLRKYQIGVLREPDGHGGSSLLHKIFNQGRKIFISRPINHFPLNESATKTYLLGGGIGITPMLAMAHRLHFLDKDFELHYSCKSRDKAAFLQDIKDAAWTDKVVVHLSNEGTRMDLQLVLGQYQSGAHVYICGPEHYMQAALEICEKNAWPDEAVHKEYFTLPELPEYVNYAFKLKLAHSGKEIEVAADQSPTDALAANGIHVDIKCSDGICGVCKCSLLSGEVEHRDFVLSKAQRKNSIILCQSRAAKANGIVEIDL